MHPQRPSTSAARRRGSLVSPDRLQAGRPVTTPICTELPLTTAPASGEQFGNRLQDPRKVKRAASSGSSSSPRTLTASALQWRQAAKSVVGGVVMAKPCGGRPPPL